MRKAVFSTLLIALGAGLWVGASRTTRFSFKNWDAAFESVVRHDLTAFGITDTSVLSSVNEIQKDANGEWVSHRIKLASLPDDKLAALQGHLESAGARVETHVEKGERVMTVKRGARVYHQIVLPR